MSDLVGNPEDRFSLDVAHMYFSGDAALNFEVELLTIERKDEL